MLNAEDIENYSGYGVNLKRYVKPLKKGNYRVLDILPTGDAPKNFVQIYHYEKGVRKAKTRTWPIYIAKVGHKWYHLESVIELLLNRIGIVFGLNMAESQLMMFGNQLRFLSRYFLKKDESLVHGAEIYAGYLQDKDFTEEVESKGHARALFTFQFAERALKSSFGEHSEQIMVEFVKMLVFDAIIGNNDRHFYNWGVIKDVKSKKNPTFAPVYDTARGLFWNRNEKYIVDTLSCPPKEMERRLNKYIDESRPKTGWEQMPEINHLLLVEKIYCTDNRYKKVCQELLREEKLKAALNLIDDEFADLMSPERKALIKECLKLRWTKLVTILNK